MQDQKIDGGKPFDWGLTSADYAKYRDIYPDVLYQTLYVLLGWIFRKNKSFRLGH